jgi:hypothetical protein
MEPLSTPKTSHEKSEEHTPPLDSSSAIPRQPPLAEKILHATQDTPAIETKSAKRTEIIIDENQETDVWWGSYAGRTMTPSFVACGLLTALIIWGVWLIWPRQENRPYLQRYTTYILVGAVWIFQVIRWGYRLVAINYRLTTRRLFCQRGFQTAATTALDLNAIATVRIERNALEGYLKVGRLRIVPVDSTQAPLVLEGIWRPDQIAALIMNQVQQARRSNN